MTEVTQRCKTPSESQRVCPLSYILAVIVTINTDSGVTKARQTMNATMCKWEIFWHVIFHALIVFNEINDVHQI